MGRPTSESDELTPHSPTELAVEIFIDHLRVAGRRTPGTLQSYHTDLVQFARFLHLWVRDGAPSLSRIDEASAAAFASDLRARGMKPATVTRKLAAVRSLGRYLAGRGVLTRSPGTSRGAGGPATRARTGTAPLGPAPAVLAPAILAPAVLSPAAMAAVLELAAKSDLAGTRDRAILEVLYGSGLRLAEVESLNLSSVDLKARAVRVTSPTGEARTVPLTPQAAAAIGRYLPRRAESLIDREVGDLEAGALFVGIRGRRFRRRSIQRAVTRYLDEAGSAEADRAETERAGEDGQESTAGRGPHALRQAFAAHLLAAGADAASVRALLGQESMPGQETAAADLESLRQRYYSAHPRASRP